MSSHKGWEEVPMFDAEEYKKPRLRHRRDRIRSCKSCGQKVKAINQDNGLCNTCALQRYKEAQRART